jgi:hypothetical protein
MSEEKSSPEDAQLANDRQSVGNRHQWVPRLSLSIRRDATRFVLVVGGITLKFAPDGKGRDAISSRLSFGARLHLTRNISVPFCGPIRLDGC